MNASNCKWWSEDIVNSTYYRINSLDFTEKILFRKILSDFKKINNLLLRILNIIVLLYTFTVYIKFIGFTEFEIQSFHKAIDDFENLDEIGKVMRSPKFFKL